VGRDSSLHPVVLVWRQIPQAVTPDLIRGPAFSVIAVATNTLFD